MTGYGKATAETGNRKVIVEIKSLNSKAMDISTRIIPAYRDKELDIRSRITAALERGKVDFSLYIDSTATSGAQVINTAVVMNYLRQIELMTANTRYQIRSDTEHRQFLSFFHKVFHKQDSPVRGDYITIS